ncbi:response regulator transcription factor [Paenibacillus sp. B2(2019)]|uniref:response regulator transcription factor n=1 Tax=Paenibacillus sp. B2(2019) TaxID=2607754 RepID=UPI0011F35712|nr:response regulator transcription factor [Paenibacillus sp. B2(2019)]KAA1187228.1 response regulator transcription factor [Paenibacillus sp. B2(2019)]
MYKILIIEDDQIMGEMLAMYLSEEGFNVQTADNGFKGMDIAKKFSPDVILLDMMLPDTTGTELCKKLRDFSTVPILVVSMKTEVSERVDALLAGADDYICKPFSMRELTAKIVAMIRRATLYQYSISEKEEAAAALSCNGDVIILDVDRRAIYVNSFFVETTFSEFEIMRLFITNEEKVFSREELLNELRGVDSFVTERAMDVHIANLRKKVEINPKEPRYIRTVWGVGYKFVSKG